MNGGYPTPERPAGWRQPIDGNWSRLLVSWRAFYWPSNAEPTTRERASSRAAAESRQKATKAVLTLQAPGSSASKRDRWFGDISNGSLAMSSSWTPEAPSSENHCAMAAATVSLCSRAATAVETNSRRSGSIGLLSRVLRSRSSRTCSDPSSKSGTDAAKRRYSAALTSTSRQLTDGRSLAAARADYHEARGRKRTDLAEARGRQVQRLVGRRASRHSLQATKKQGVVLRGVRSCSLV